MHGVFFFTDGRGILLSYELSVFSLLEMKVRDDIIIGVVFPLVYIILRKIKGKDFLCD